MRNAVTAVLWWSYYVVLEATVGATLGKRLLKLRVVAVDLGHPSLAATVLRNSGLLLGLLPFVGGLAMLIAVVAMAVTIASNEHHRGKHDERAATAVMGSRSGTPYPDGQPTSFSHPLGTER